ncbi:DUF4232 domain-containing protein [Pseudonocardia sp.]|uniref:DUF4232 domain-containing protein n=1 Tax=Pseudonocardia sp. TaxID=60912 RepID=UPI002604C094|nr:DUF4232 domain-containing protein [Pseudonocardia sp.]
MISPSRSTARAVAVLALVVAAGGCAAAPDPAPAPSTSPSAPPSTSPAPVSETSSAPAAQARCTAADLTVGLGEPAGEGQRTVPIVYTNSSAQPCGIRGVPGVDLVGPPDPNGETYQVLRPGATDERPEETLRPGESATATLTYLTYEPGSVGSLGSTEWVPARVVTTPPGDTAQLTVPWTSGDTVLRQDSATRPGTFVGPLTVDS